MMSHSNVADNTNCTQSCLFLKLETPVVEIVPTDRPEYAIRFDYRFKLRKITVLIKR